jgi:hypothetical protein
MIAQELSNVYPYYVDLMIAQELFNVYPYYVVLMIAKKFHHFHVALRDAGNRFQS